MKKSLKLFALLIITGSLMTCEKWNLDKENFISIETGNVVSQNTTSISIRGEIVGLENGKVTQHGHLFSRLNPQPEFEQEGTESALLGATFGSGAFTNNIEGLIFNNTYYFRAIAFREGSDAPIYGEIIEVAFGDGDAIVQVKTESVNLFTGGFELYGSLTGLPQGIEITKYGFVWSNENTAPEIENDEVIYLGSINSNQSFDVRLENMEQLKEYHVRAFIELGREVFYGETKSFFKGDVWRRLADAPSYMAMTYFSVVGDAVYTGGGFGSEDPDIDLQNIHFYKFTPSADIWESKPSLFQNHDIITNSGAGFTIDDLIYVTTGWGGIANDVWIYDTVEEIWTKSNDDFPGPPAITAAVTAVKQNKAIMGWGRDSFDDVVTDFWIYDPNNGWDSVTSFEFPKRQISFIFSRGDEIWLGFDPFGVDQNLYHYNLGTGEWDEILNSSLPDVYPEGFSGITIGNKGYVVLSAAANNCWEYDLDTNRWKQKADYPGSGKQEPIHFTIDGKGYYGLGADVSLDIPSKDMWEYIPDVEEL